MNPMGPKHPESKRPDSAAFSAAETCWVPAPWGSTAQKTMKTFLPVIVASGELFVVLLVIAPGV